MNLDFPSRILNEGYDPSNPVVYLRRAYGCYVEDLDGQRYIDTSLGGGTAILGHAPAILRDAIQAQLPYGTLFTLPNPAAHEFAELLHEVLPWFDRFVFCSSGSEATLRAIRIARAATGKRKIGMFSGGWHGSHDFLLVEEDYCGVEARPTPRLKSAGSPREILDLIEFLPYNHPAALELIREHRRELAMVLIEPAQGSNPRDDVGPFLRDLRKVTRECGVLLGFDEVITGFRVALGGAQAYYDLPVDIATYGKVIGGGSPVGLVSGTSAVMDTIRGDPGVFMGGTFSANPLTVAAGLATLRHLRDNEATVYTQLAARGVRLRREINAYCDAHCIAARMIGIGSISRLLFTNGPVASRRQRDHLESNQGLQKQLYAALQQAGVHVGGHRNIFLSTEHSDEIVDAILVALCRVLTAFHQEGHLR